MNVYSGVSSVQDFSAQKTDGKPDRSKPIRPVPTDRISPEKQLLILRTWATASNNRARAATVVEVSKMVDMAGSTVAMANPFFSSIGLIQRLDVGTYSPSEQVIEFAAAHECNPGQAAYSLAPAFRDAWFGKILLSKLADGPLYEEAAISLLMADSEAGPEYKKAFVVLLDLMTASGLLLRNGGQVALRPGPVVLKKNGKGAQICVTIRIDAKDLSGWAPDQIGALLEGLAELMAKQK
jgi:hypothetical protein